MARTARKLIGQSLIVSALSTVALLVWFGIRLVPETSPVARGTASAYAGDCINCHGQPGQALSDSPKSECNGETSKPTHPSYKGDCRDLLAYFEAVRLKRMFSQRANSPNQNRLLKGEALARQYNCFQCHGELGQGGFSNRGALKGYIPGYFGEDFAVLTRSGRINSVRSWISQGIDRSLYENRLTGPIARFFIEQQEVSMPKFSTLPESEIQILAEYVIALNEFGPMTATDVRAYAEATTQ